MKKQTARVFGEEGRSIIHRHGHRDAGKDVCKKVGRRKGGLGVLENSREIGLKLLKSDTVSRGRE
jgi:hypothetical protein